MEHKINALIQQLTYFYTIFMGKYICDILLAFSESLANQE